MTVTAYFARRRDTSIACEDDRFIESLEHRARTTGVVTPRRDPATADLVLVDERYAYRTRHYRFELESCPFVRRHAARILVLNHDDVARPFLGGLYTSLEADRPPRVAARPIPYKRDLWRIALPRAAWTAPRALYTFRGTLHSHAVRPRLARALAGDPSGRFAEHRKALHDHDEEDQRHFAHDILDAAFSLCPRGWSPSTYRVYESMQLGRCPVVIADAWVPPPGPDWDALSLRIAQSDVERLPALLAARRDEAESRGRRAREAWQRWFSWPARRDYFLEQALSLHAARGAGPGFDELAAIWRAPGFARLYGWDPRARLRRGLARLLRWKA